jgi:hypothetical protein
MYINENASPRSGVPTGLAGTVKYMCKECRIQVGEYEDFALKMLTKLQVERCLCRGTYLNRELFGTTAICRPMICCPMICRPMICCPAIRRPAFEPQLVHAVGRISILGTPRA